METDPPNLVNTPRSGSSTDALGCLHNRPDEGPPLLGLPRATKTSAHRHRSALRSRLVTTRVQTPTERSHEWSSISAHICPAVYPNELRRRIHTRGRVGHEPTAASRAWYDLRGRRIRPNVPVHRYTFSLVSGPLPPTVQHLQVLTPAGSRSQRDADDVDMLGPWPGARCLLEHGRVHRPLHQRRPRPAAQHPRRLLERLAASHGVFVDELNNLRTCRPLPQPRTKRPPLTSTRILRTGQGNGPHLLADLSSLRGEGGP